MVLHVGVRHLDSWEFPCDSAVNPAGQCRVVGDDSCDVSPSAMVNLEMNSTKNKVIPAACACIGLMAGYMDGFKSLVNRWDRMACSKHVTCF